MKNSVKLALGFITLSTLTGGIAYAQMDNPGPDEGAGPGPRFEMLDVDKSGDVTLEEFKKAAGDRFQLADTNKDGKVTVEEMAVAIEKMRAEMMAKRMIDRLDTDKDGALSQAEMEAGRDKMFARFDRNSDGKLVADEMPHGKGHGRHGGKHHGDGGNNG